MTNQALALPSLDGIPAYYTVPVADSFLRPLALSMLNDGMITAADVARRPSSMMSLCTKALTREWQRVASRLSLFQWNLRLEESTSSQNFRWRKDENDPKAWALITTNQGPVSAAIVCVGPAVEYLEKLRAGLGQTILAALYDVLDMLPSVCTTTTIIGMGQYSYWHGWDNEEDAIKELLVLHDCTREELLTSSEFITHKEMFGPMPDWAAKPERVLNRAQINSAARGNPFASDIVDAMDELWTALTFCGPFPDLSDSHVDADLIDFSLIVRWTENDSAGRIIDDYARYAYEGDYIEAASATPIRVTDGCGHASLKEWLQKMQSAALLAGAAERVLTLLGEHAEARTLVRMFA